MRYAGLEENIGFHLVKVKGAAAKSGAEMAVSISGDNIKTIMHYYADPAQPNIGAVRIIDLL